MDFNRLAMATCAVVSATLFADSTWIGANCSTNPSAWSVSENWDGGVPTGSAKANIPYMEDKNYVLHFTPPLDFTGEIAGGRDSTTWDIKYPTYLKLTVLDGATWTVGGNGHLIATEGIAARLASTFSGTVLIPPGMSFVAASTLNAKIEYVGKGTLTLTTANQLSHISGFSGTLVWNGPEGSSLTPVDMAVLQQHGIRLGNGASIILRNRFLSINGVHEIPDWNEAPSDWNFNGSTNGTAASSRFTFDEMPPHANAAGELELVNDAAQVHSVFYKGRKLKMHDSWGISFHWKPAGVLPAKYAGYEHVWSGFFGFYFAADPATCGSTWTQPGGTGQGFGINFWDDIAAGWQFNRSGIGVPVRSDVIAAIGDGIDFKKESDVDVTCQNGTLTITVTQGNKMFAVQRPTFNQETNLQRVPDGYYIGLAAASDWWNDTNGRIPMSTHMISNFRGWYRAREAHGWQQVPDNVYPFTSANCTARIYTDASTYVENAAALRPDGSFQLEPYGSRTRNILRSTCAFDRLNKYLVTFDLVAGEGTAAENTEYTKLGFVKCQDAISSWVFKYDNIISEEWDGYAYPLMMTMKWYNKGARFWADNSGRANRQHSDPYATIPSMVKGTTTHVSLVYDGQAGIYYQAQSGKHSLDFGWIPPASVQNCWTNEVKNPMRFQISHANSWGQVDTVLSNFVVRTLTTPDTGYIDGEISVAAGAAATLSADASAEGSPIAAAKVRRVSLAAGSELSVSTDVAGSRVEVESIVISGAGARLSSTAKTMIGGNLIFTGNLPNTAAVLSGDVTFAGGSATLTVPEAWRGADHGVIPLFTLESTSSGTLPSAFRLVTDAGRDITGKAYVLVKGNTVNVILGRGSVFTIR